MIAQLLLYKILQLFIIMILGYILVKVGILKSKDSLILSKLSLYLFMPAVIINAFNIERTEAVTNGLILAFIAAILIHVVLILIDLLLKKFKATSIERASVMYSNAGNLIVPIVTFIFGEECVVYSCAYIVVQMSFLWTHGVRLFSENEKFDIKKILFNINIIAVFIGFIIMILDLKIPVFAGDIISSLGGMLAPVGMIIAGMLAAEIDFSKMLLNRRLYFVTFARLIVCPAIAMILVKWILSVADIENARNIVLIVYLASITPSASTVMQLSQIYGKDAQYSVVINTVTTVLCIATMPLLILFF